MPAQSSNRVPKFVPRANESLKKAQNRCGRFYYINDSWFFKTREGFDYGPYSSKTECKYAYDEFIDVVSSQVELRSVAVDFQDSGTNWKVPKISLG